MEMPNIFLLRINVFITIGPSVSASLSNIDIPQFSWSDEINLLEESDFYFCHLL